MLQLMPANQDRLLDLEQTREWLADHGLPYTVTQMRRIAGTRKLPFRRAPDGRKLVVRLSDLQRWLDGEGGK